MAPGDSTDRLPALDNPVWYALNTHQAQFSIGKNLAKRYPPLVAPYCAVADHSDAAFNDLTRIVAQGVTVRLFERDSPPELPSWTLNQTYVLNQMVCDQLVAEPQSDAKIVDLSETDVPEILRLVELSHPGPFLARTIAMGHYIGIHH